jgi:hypothetical protein
VEIFGSTKDQSLALWDTLHLVCPLPGNLDGRLDCLGTSVHGQNHVIAENFPDFLSPLWEDIVMECAGGEGKPLRLCA